jgi:hypothetical protein
MSYTDSLVDIARRRERLIARAALQRDTVAVACRTLERPAALIDRGVGAVMYLKAHPLLLAAGVLAVTLLGRRNLAAWAGRGWVLWRAWRSFSAWSVKLRV